MFPSKSDRKDPEHINKVLRLLGRFTMWVVGIPVYLTVVSRLAPSTEPKRSGVISLGIAALLFFMVWTRPAIVRGARYNQWLRYVANENDPDDRTGEAYFAVLGFFCAVYGLFTLLLR